MNKDNDSSWVLALLALALLGTNENKEDVDERKRYEVD